MLVHGEKEKIIANEDVRSWRPCETHAFVRSPRNGLDDVVAVPAMDAVVVGKPKTKKWKKPKKSLKSRF